MDCQLDIKIPAVDEKAAIAKLAIALSGVVVSDSLECEADEEEGDCLQKHVVTATIQLTVWGHDEEDAQRRARAGIVIPDPDINDTAELHEVIAQSTASPAVTP